MTHKIKIKEIMDILQGIENAEQKATGSVRNPNFYDISIWGYKEQLQEANTQFDRNGKTFAEWITQLIEEEKTKMTIEEQKLQQKVYDLQNENLRLKMKLHDMEGQKTKAKAFANLNPHQMEILLQAKIFEQEFGGSAEKYITMWTGEEADAVREALQLEPDKYSADDREVIMAYLYDALHNWSTAKAAKEEHGRSYWQGVITALLSVFEMQRVKEENN